MILILYITITSCKNDNIISNDITIDDYDYNIEAVNEYAFNDKTISETVKEIKEHHNYPYLDLGDSNPIVISEKQFLTRLANLYNNIDKYKDRDVSIDGLYGNFVSYDGSFDFPMVYRNGPGCCKDDKYGGIYLVNLENVVNEGTQIVEGDFVSVLGSPFLYEYTDSNGNVKNYLFLITKSIAVLPTNRRGAEMVND